MKYTVTVFKPDGTYEVSPRVSYSDALRYAEDCNAAISFDERAQIIYDGVES